MLEDRNRIRELGTDVVELAMEPIEFSTIILLVGDIASQLVVFVRLGFGPAGERKIDCVLWDLGCLS